MKRLLLLFVPLLLALTVVSSAQAAKDRNHDGLPDRWEVKHHLSLKTNQAKKDQDKDKLNNLGEFQSGTNPRDKDTDNDGVKDGSEDADEDGLNNRSEVKVGTNPRKKDSNGDGTKDGDTNAGEVVSFVDGVLTLKLFGGDTVTGHVTDTTQLFCPKPATPAAAKTAARSKRNGDEHPGQKVWQFKGQVTAVDLDAATVTVTVKKAENPAHMDFTGQSVTFHYGPTAKFYKTNPNAVIALSDVKIGDVVGTSTMAATGSAPDTSAPLESMNLVDYGAAPTQGSGEGHGGNGGNGGNGGGLGGNGGNGGQGSIEHPGQDGWQFLGRVTAIDADARTVTVQVKESENPAETDFAGQSVTFHYADTAKFYKARPAGPATFADVQVGDGVRTGTFVPTGTTPDTATVLEAPALLDFGPPEHGDDSNTGEDGPGNNGNHDGNKHPPLKTCDTTALVAGAYVREAALNLEGGQLTFKRILMARPKA